MLKQLKWTGLGILVGLFILLSKYLIINDIWLISLFNGHFISDTHKLTISRSNNSISLDPAVAIDLESVRVTVNVYETLVKYRHNQIMPGLAESWSVSEDGLTWTFHLRDDVYFHDNNLMDADAIVFNFDRWRLTDNPYHAGHFVYWNMNFGGFPGLVSDVRSIDNDTIVITLDKPYAPFLSTLAMPAFGIASPEAIMKYNDNIKTKPVGTGPFVFKSWDEDGHITLEKNYNYWGVKSSVEELHFIVVEDDLEEIKMLENGDIQIANDLTDYEIETLQLNRNISLKNRSYFNVGYLAFNMNHPSLKQLNVRQAIGHLISKEDMITKAFNKYTKIAHTFVPPVLWGYNESIESLQYNVTKGKVLLNEVVDEPLTLKLLVMSEARPYFPHPIELAEYIQEQLKIGGINVVIDAKPMSDFLMQIQHNDYDLLLMGWTGDVIDPDNFLYTFFSSENMKEGIVSNYAHYSNSSVDMLLRQARQVTDQSFRDSIYREIQKIIAEEVPAIPLVHTVPIYGISNKISGFEPGLSGVEPLNEVYFKED